MHLLARLAREVVVPPAVLREIGDGPRPLAPEQIGPHRVAAVTGIHPIVTAWDLGLGESEVVSIAASLDHAVRSWMTVWRAAVQPRWVWLRAEC